MLMQCIMLIEQLQQTEQSRSLCSVTATHFVQCFSQRVFLVDWETQTYQYKHMPPSH